MWNPLSKKNPTDSIFSVQQLTTLAIEHWRLDTALTPTHPPAPARHALRKIADLLQTAGIQAQSLDQLPYDPGMSATVVDRILDPTLPPGSATIIETLSPLVTLHGQVIKPAEIVISAAS